MAQAGRIGFRVFTCPTRPDAELVRKFADFASANLADALGRFHFMDSGIQSRTGLSLCGVAVTVMARPGDNLMVHKAMEIAQPGEVVVVSTNGNTTNAVFGELMGHSAVASRLGGMDVDGGDMDAGELAASGFAAFSRTIPAGGCDTDGPAELNGRAGSSATERLAGVMCVARWAV